MTEKLKPEKLKTRLGQKPVDIESIKFLYPENRDFVEGRTKKLFAPVEAQQHIDGIKRKNPGCLVILLCIVTVVVLPILIVLPLAALDWLLEHFSLELLVITVGPFIMAFVAGVMIYTMLCLLYEQIQSALYDRTGKKSLDRLIERGSLITGQVYSVDSGSFSGRPYAAIGYVFWIRGIPTYRIYGVQHKTDLKKNDRVFILYNPAISVLL